MKPKYGSPFPDPEQELLLKACLLKNEDMLTAFHQWRECVDFETDVERGSFRLLPLLYFNLMQHQVEDPLMGRLKGIYRQSWSKNQFLFRKAGIVVETLASSGMETMLIKGIPLSLRTYKNHGVRPMADTDILVKMDKAEDAFEALKAAGWKSIDPVHDLYHLKNSKSITLSDDDKTELDLHWQPFDECHGLMQGDDFWDKAMPVKVSNTKTLALCPADELLLSFVHGLAPNPEPPIRWIADAMTIINQNKNEIDWQRFMEYTKKFSVVIPVKEALKYLKETFDAPVPENIYTEINRLKPGLADKLMYRKKGVFVYHPSFKKIFTAYISFLKDPSRKGLIAKHIGFINFIRERSKGKPHFKILVYYIRVMIRYRKKQNAA